MRAPDFNSWRRIPLDVAHYDFLRLSPGKRFSSALLQAFGNLVVGGYDRLVLGLRIRGKENLKALEGGAMLICNHVHWLDCTMILRAVWPHRLYFISQLSNMELPAIRHLLRVARCMPVPEELRQLPLLSHAMEDVLRSGGFVILYPEGSLEPYCESLRPFKNGAFSHARDAGVPVLPMRLTYRKGKGLWALKRRPAFTLHILPPIYPDSAAPRGREIARLRDDAFRAMEEANNA